MKWVILGLAGRTHFFLQEILTKREGNKGEMEVSEFRFQQHWL